MTNPIADPIVEVVDNDASSDLVLIEATQEGAVTVTMNRPAKKNAFDPEMIGALHEAFLTLESQPNVRVVFLQGAGAAFSAGDDPDWVKASVDYSDGEHRDDALAAAKMLKALHDIPAMTVALVDGDAFGTGAGLVAACDLAVATEAAKFSFADVRVGLIPAVVSPYAVAAVGPRNAKVLFATGRVFGADDAQRWGLVQEVVAEPAMLAIIKDALGKGMLDCAPGAVGEAKALVDFVAYQQVDHELLHDLSKKVAAQRTSEEGQEGVAAYLEGRKPSWSVI
jgi:methylglutaconyl-CoA hydratase